ncbi:MAG: helix-turn-helix transcriptional regulator [Methylotenera sp.]|nr:helix-turn-helix transcriptional regulator [Methylotenera sp.]
MEVQQTFAKALKQIRKAHGLTQEDFSDVSSRTYISTLERGLKNPTIEKVDTLARVIGVHPLTLLALAYLIERGESEPSKLLKVIAEELNQVLN